MRFAAILIKSALAAAALLLIVDIIVRLSIPERARLRENFSAYYLHRMVAPDRLNGQNVFLGDSALWGYKVAESESAVGLLRNARLPVINLSYEGGSTPNTYALTRIILKSGARPAAIFFNLNLKEFNPEDSAYNTLYPAVERLAAPLLSARDRDALKRTTADSLDDRIDARLSTFWALYGMRTEIRQDLFGAADAATALLKLQHSFSSETKREADAHRPTAERFLGTYDLSPLDERNAGVSFLRETLAELRENRIPTFVILTPTNHSLLHEYIDVPEYDKNLDYLSSICKHAGARVLNYDRTFPSGDFIDNDHLTVRGNSRLASLLRAEVIRP